MSHTIFFLTATLVTGQAPATEIIKIPQSSPPAVVGDPVANTSAPTLWDRMKSWKPFKRNSDSVETTERPRLFQRLFQRNSMPADSNVITPPLAPSSGNSLQTKRVEPPLASSAGARDSNLFVAPITFHPAGAPATLSLASAAKPLSPAVAEKVGHDPDYTWITGQLRKEKGKWIIYFANPEVVDRYNGRLILNAPADQMSNFREGDIVSVQGRTAGSEGSATASYTATQVNLVEHESH